MNERRRRHLLATPFPEPLQELVEQRTPAYELLAAGERARLHDLVQVFIAEKRWEGCGGLELTDEIRVTIAAMACVMLIGRDHELFAGVETILVYPTVVELPAARQYTRNTPKGAVHAGPTSGVRLPSGEIVLAWDVVLEDARTRTDGANVVIHVLSHAIDVLDGIQDGVPPIADRAGRAAWTATMQAAFDAHGARRTHGEVSFLADHALDSPAEYFAVAAESFFECPIDLARELPEVYDVLRSFFALDLAPRSAISGAPYRT
jgi:hypothetical protein